MLLYLSEASEMGTRLRLFGVEDQTSPDEDSELSAEAQRARMYAAWGVFNWITYETSWGSARHLGGGNRSPLPLG